MSYSARAFILVVLLISAAGASRGEVIDRVVAFVDSTAITMRELDAEYAESVKISPEITRPQVLDTMINRYLLLREARNLRLRAEDDISLLNDYIDLKIKAFIRISEEAVRDFYDSNKANFGGVTYFEVKDDIEKYLIEREVNERLKDHIEDLRRKAYVKVLL